MGKTNKLIKIILIIVVVLLGAKYGLDWYSQKLESANVYSVNAIAYDNSTYNYVKQKCKDGLFAKNSVNCNNLQKAEQQRSKPNPEISLFDKK